MKTVFIASTVLLLAGCQTAVPYTPPENVDQQVLDIMEQHNAASVGIGIIRDHKLVWTGYYGEQSPRVPVGPRSMFNTASVNKAVTAETALSLATKGLIDLDEPISAHYVHPDIEDDPRHQLLTPRILLTHQAGFRNWPFEYEDGNLAFIDHPGNGVYNYSGIGFRIFAKFLEAKLELPYPQIVRREIFDPFKMSDATNSHDQAAQRDNIIVPVDADGEFRTDYEFESGYWSAADDLFVSVPDYAAFLIATSQNRVVNETIRSDRERVLTEMTDHPIWECGIDAVDPCPSPYGHGIGWFVFGTEAGLTIHHGGNDRSEGAIGYYQPSTGNGGVVFINSAQGVLAWPKIVDLVDPQQDFQDVFHDLIKKFFSDQ